MRPVEFILVNVAVVACKLRNSHFWWEKTGRPGQDPRHRQVDIAVWATQSLGAKTRSRINHLPGQFKLNPRVTATATFHRHRFVVARCGRVKYLRRIRTIGDGFLYGGNILGIMIRIMAYLYPVLSPVAITPNIYRLPVM